jgi:lipopolysaccharide export system protein LptA
MSTFLFPFNERGQVMDRRLLVAALAVLLAGGVPPAQAADLKIEAGAQGVKVQAAGLQGSAPRLSYDDAKGILVLEGTGGAPATLVRSWKGQNEEVRAAKIIYSLKEGTLRTESAGVIRTLKP